MRDCSRDGSVSNRTLDAMDTDDLLLLARTRALLASGQAQRIRKIAGLQRTEVAAAAGVSIAALQRWEARTQVPRGTPALRYARVLARLAEQFGDSQGGTDAA
jgi:DNA-binding transcriptional regulator YiaG